MQRITIELTGNNSLSAIKALEKKELIRIIREPAPDCYSLPGEPMSEESFKEWVRSAEESQSVNIAEAKSLWTAQKRKLRKLIP